MGLKRKQIREAVVSLLQADSTLTALVPSSRIYESRVETIWNSKLPAVAVYTKNETSEDFSQFSRIVNRSVELAIEIIVDGTQDIDDDLDEISDAIEQILLDSATLVNSELWQDIQMKGFETTFASEGSKQIGAGRMEFEIQYQSLFN